MERREVKVRLEVSIVLLIDEGTSPAEIVNELGYTFSDGTGKAHIRDTEITGFDEVPAT